MYLEKKKIAGEVYNYLKLSVRYKNKVRTKTIAYLGKGNMPKEELKSALNKYQEKAERIKPETLEELKFEVEQEARLFLTPQQWNKVEEIKHQFQNKLRQLDEKTRQEMFTDFSTLYIYNTNAIEGNTFTLRDTDLLLNQGITPQGKSLREINDHLNAQKAFQCLLTQKIKMSHESIIKIHSMLMNNIDERVGVYRKHNVRVIGATFETTLAEYVKADVEILLQWYRNNKARFHPLIIAAAFHHKFERIHPFYDGNGRTGRMLLNLIVMQNSFPPLVVPNAQRKRYYAALSTADKAELSKILPQHKEIVQFCYFSLLKTWNTVFKRWG